MAPIEGTLQGLAQVQGYEGLTLRINEMYRRVTEAVDDLARLAPPASLASEHGRFVGALRRFKGEVAFLVGRVGFKKMCTGALVRTEMARADGADVLRSLAGFPRAEPVEETRPANGSIVRRGTFGGRWKLTVGNGLFDDDAVVAFAQGGELVLSVYVRRNASVVVTGVPGAGNDVFYATGNGWDGRIRAFNRDCAFKRFDEEPRYRSTKDIWRIDLMDVGGLRAVSVGPGGFPD
ncbi:hypothetical protein ACQEU3_15830 [Spirillospora sp. CA-253888]